MLTAWLVILATWVYNNILQLSKYAGIATQGPALFFQEPRIIDFLKIGLQVTNYARVNSRRKQSSLISVCRIVQARKIFQWNLHCSLFRVQLVQGREITCITDCSSRWGSLPNGGEFLKYHRLWASDDNRKIVGASILRKWPNISRFYSSNLVHIYRIGC